jgi:hypothetical protein
MFFQTSNINTPLFIEPEINENCWSLEISGGRLQNLLAYWCELTVGIFK